MPNKTRKAEPNAALAPDGLQTDESNTDETLSRTQTKRERQEEIPSVIADLYSVMQKPKAVKVEASGDFYEPAVAIETLDYAYQ